MYIMEVQYNNVWELIPIISIESSLRSKDALCRHYQCTGEEIRMTAREGLTLHKVKREMDLHDEHIQYVHLA